MPSTKSDREKGRPRTKNEQRKIRENYHNIQIKYLLEFGNTKYRPLFVNEWIVRPFPIDEMYEEEFMNIINYYKSQIDLDKLTKEFEMEYGTTVNEYKNQVVRSVIG